MFGFYIVVLFLPSLKFNAPITDCWFETQSTLSITQRHHNFIWHLIPFPITRSWRACATVRQ